MAGPSMGSTKRTARSSPCPGDRNHGSVPPEVTWCAWSPGSLARDGEQDGAIPALELLPLLVLCLFTVCVSSWGWQRAQGLVGSATPRLKTSVFSPKISLHLFQEPQCLKSHLSTEGSLLRPASPRCLEGRGASGNYLQRFVGPSRAKGAGGCPSRPPHPPGRLWGRPGVAPVCVIAGLPGNLS